MFEIDKEIAEKYSLDIKNIVPFKEDFILITPRGKRILKKTPFSPERVMFIHGAKEHLYKKNFKNLDRYLCTSEGKPYFTYEGSNYTISELVEGRECNFESRDDVINASRLLAHMHKASKGYTAPAGSSSRDELGKLPSYFMRRLDEIRKLKKVAKKGKNKFDYLFLEHVDYFYNLGEDAINLILNSNYEALTEKSRQEGILCHHDFAHHNVICGDDKISLINFEYCCYEIKVYDLANLIRRKMRKCNWNVNEAKLILTEYRDIEELGEDEIFVMKLILQFPQKFWRVVNKYYNSKRSWSEKSYIVKLQEVIDEGQYHKEFMNKFDTLV